MSEKCKFCNNGWLENKYGEDVECVNGVLIDIDTAMEGWRRDVIYPVAPCHPMWERQQEEDDFPNDSQERLAEWAGSPMTRPTAMDIERALDAAFAAVLARHPEIGRW